MCTFRNLNIILVFNNSQLDSGPGGWNILQQAIAGKKEKTTEAARDLTRARSLANAAQYHGYYFSASFNDCGTIFCTRFNDWATIFYICFNDWGPIFYIWQSY